MDKRAVGGPLAFLFGLLFNGKAHVASRFLRSRGLVDVLLFVFRVQDLTLPGEDVGLWRIMLLRSSVQPVSLGEEHFGEGEGRDEVDGLFLLSLLTVFKLKEVGLV